MLDECLSAGLEDFVKAMKRIWEAVRKHPFYLILTSTGSKLSELAPPLQSANSEKGGTGSTNLLPDTEIERYVHTK